MERTSTNCTGVAPDDRYETRRLTDDIIVTGNRKVGYSLFRGLKYRMIPLAGDTLDKAYFNAAMGLLGEKDIDALFKPPRDPVREPSPGFIYFIGAEVGGVKIGFAVNPELRLKTLQCGSPVKLGILAVRAGLPKDERDYHKRFKDHRQHGEWFERAPEIMAEIERLAA